MQAININLGIPKTDWGFFQKLANSMGWDYQKDEGQKALFDPETNEYLNEETMKAIAESESGKGDIVCNTFDDFLKAIEDV